MIVPVNNEHTMGAILRSYVNVNVPDSFKDWGGCTHLLHAFATRESRKNLTISETIRRDISSKFMHEMAPFFVEYITCPGNWGFPVVTSSV